MSCFHSIAHEEDGFTLVEAIVALAILALVLTSAVEVLGNGSIRQRLDEQRTVALLHAQSQLANVAAAAAVSPGTVEGTFDDGYAWRLSASPLAMGSETPQVLIPYAVTMEVSKSDGDRSIVRLKTVVLAPQARREQ